MIPLQIKSMIGGLLRGQLIEPSDIVALCRVSCTLQKIRTCNLWLDSSNAAKARIRGLIEAATEASGGRVVLNAQYLEYSLPLTRV